MDKYKKAFQKACEQTGGTLENNSCKWENQEANTEQFKQQLNHEIAQQIDQSIQPSSKIKTVDKNDNYE